MTLKEIIEIVGSVSEDWDVDVPTLIIELLQEDVATPEENLNEVLTFVGPNYEEIKDVMEFVEIREGK